MLQKNRGDIDKCDANRGYEQYFYRALFYNQQFCGYGGKTIK